MLTFHNYQLYYLKGSAVKNFLQGQVCSDINLLKEGGSSLTGICNAKGRLVASPYLLLKDGEYYLSIEYKMAEILFDYWKPYLMISRVQALLCENYKAYGLLEASKNSYHFSIQCAGHTQAMIIFTKENLDSLCATTPLAWFNEMIKSGVVVISPETTKEWMPLTLGYDGFGALSFNKGCYVGQEILARVHYKGSVNQMVAPIYFDEPTVIHAYQEIRNDQNNLIGHVAICHEMTVPVKSTLAVLQKNVNEKILKLNNGILCKIG